MWHQTGPKLLHQIVPPAVASICPPSCGTNCPQLWHKLSLKLWHQNVAPNWPKSLAPRCGIKMGPQTWQFVSDLGRLGSLNTKKILKTSCQIFKKESTNGKNGDFKVLPQNFGGKSPPAGFGFFFVIFFLGTSQGNPAVGWTPRTSQRQGGVQPTAFFFSNWLA